MSLPETPEAWVRLGSRIRAERERRGMSRKALADLANVSAGSVQAAEKGTVPKGRWPQTLSAIEKALDWAPGSMRSVLDGGEVEYQPSLFDNSAEPASAAHAAANAGLEIEASFTASGTVQRAHTWWFQQLERLNLPEEIRKVLPQVTFFATSSVLHGAPEWMASALGNTAYMMLEQVHEKRLAESLRKPVTTVEESDQRVRDLEAELQRTRETKEAMEALLMQASGSEEADAQFKEDLRLVREMLENGSSE